MTECAVAGLPATVHLKSIVVASAVCCTSPLSQVAGLKGPAIDCSITSVVGSMHCCTTRAGALVLSMLVLTSQSPGLRDSSCAAPAGAAHSRTSIEVRVISRIATECPAARYFLVFLTVFWVVGVTVTAPFCDGTIDVGLAGPPIRGGCFAGPPIEPWAKAGPANGRAPAKSRMANVLVRRRMLRCPSNGNSPDYPAFGQAGARATANTIEIPQAASRIDLANAG